MEFLGSIALIRRPTLLRPLALFGLLGLILLTPGCAKKIPVARTSRPLVIQQTSCDEGLWRHIYAGRFQSPQERLRVLQPCITVTGTIVNAAPEPDGDFHIRLAVDPPFESLLNAKNNSGEHGYLVVEPVCENPVTQADTVQEQVCSGFSQQVFTTDMVGKHVAVTGAYVTDMEHGWNEIHPVSSIVVQ